MIQNLQHYIVSHNSTKLKFMTIFAIIDRGCGIMLTRLVIGKYKQIEKYAYIFKKSCD